MEYTIPMKMWNVKIRLKAEIATLAKVLCNVTSC